MHVGNQLHRVLSGVLGRVGPGRHCHARQLSHQHQQTAEAVDINLLPGTRFRGVHIKENDIKVVNTN